MEYDAVGGTLYLSALDVNNAVPTVIASNSVSSPSEAPLKLAIGDKDTSGTPTPTDGGWVGTIKDFVIYNSDMNLRGSGVEPSFVPTPGPGSNSSTVSGRQITGLQIGIAV